jgi:phthiocerol/phenolphthiocerol synthesis type-I polyketide synthase E
MNPELATRDTDIAIIGMACRFPGADNVEQFWQHLCEGRESTTFFTDQELLDAGVPQALLDDSRYVKASQIIRGVEMFDADHFGITHEEAELLDPQHRLFLEIAQEALENAGYYSDAQQRSISVYAGAGMNTYLLNNLVDRFNAGSTVDRYRLMLANDKDFLATRVSYRLDLRGPSVNVSTACSTSLVAVHLAGLSLLGGESDVALAGGVHVKVPQVEGYLFQKGMIFSPDGRCRAFDAEAQGTVLGDGAGVVVLRRLADAVRDGDWIHAVIKGTAINNDGGVKTSYTAPSVAGQAAVIAEAQALAGCDSDTVSFVECHGTGTELGDAVEIAALKQVFSLEATTRCAIGSVKTNIGHLDAASGIAGLIKAVLMLEHRRLVPTLHFKAPHAELDLGRSPFYVNTAAIDWPARATPRRAGVSSFGIGGTNAHAIVEEPPAPVPATASRDPVLVVLSARSATAIETVANDLARHLHELRSTLNLADVAYTLAIGRRPHRHRRALVCCDAHDAAVTLMVGDPDRVLNGQAEASIDVAFVFPDRLDGGGARAAALYRGAPIFRDAVDRCLATVDTPIAADPVSLLETGGAQATVVAGYALAELWMSLGVRPKRLAGVGVGETAAACVGGAYPMQVALALAGGDKPYVIPTTARLPLWPITPSASGAPAVSPSTLFDGQLPVEMRLDDFDPAPSGRESLLRIIGSLWTRGAAIDWASLFAGERRRRVPLPTYPFDRRRFWIERQSRVDARTQAVRSGAGTLRRRVDAAQGQEKSRIVLDFIQREVAAILGLDAAHSVDPDQNLFNLGIGSLDLIEIAARLSTELQQEVPVSLFIDHPTIRVYVDNLFSSSIVDFDDSRR